MKKTAILEPVDRIYEFRITREPIRNAIDFDVMEELSLFLEDISDNKSARAVIITGEGDRAFCSGGDLAAFHQLHTKEEAFKMLSKMGNILYDLAMLPFPTYALLNGAAVGGGSELAIACDFRIAKKDIMIGFIQGNQAITTGWGGGTLLFEKLQHANAMQLLTSAKKVNAEIAKEWGFIQQIIAQENFRDHAYHQIDVNLVPYSSVLSAYKKIKIRQWEQSKLKERMLAEIEACAQLWEGESHLQAVNQFIKKSK
ncbi:enoyl-CoA hydratase/isomerase family protein [Metabacillus arenae]|uniref:enoyl-CoA hydratase/isomerase family protein n=1 Tax=Metabacillus arenae TaxID=2771434 RepID=UPI001CD09CB6|nr:enoyl-CoA hydratase/isomerase family protein [Metabacillus arenae]